MRGSLMCFLLHSPWWLSATNGKGPHLQLHAEASR